MKIAALLLLLGSSALAASEHGPLYDPEMTGCQASQPGARVGDVVHCPISGALFRVSKTSAKRFEAKHGKG